MFDRDLQDEIRNENNDFIAQAMERAAAAKEEKPKKIALSGLEKEIPATAIKDFSNDALEQYQTIARIKDQVGSSGFNRRLVQQGLLMEKGGKFTPTGFGLLLFGRQPRNVMPQAGLLATIHYPDGNEEPKDFDGPMVLIPGLAEGWLSDKLPNVIDRSSMRRKESPPLPFEMVREAIVNALIHRDYDIRQAKCHLSNLAWSGKLARGHRLNMRLFEEIIGIPSEAIRTRNMAFCPDIAEKYHFLFLSGHEYGHSVRIGSCGAWGRAARLCIRLLDREGNRVKMPAFGWSKKRQMPKIMPVGCRDLVIPNGRHCKSRQ